MIVQDNLPLPFILQPLSFLLLEKFNLYSLHGLVFPYYSLYKRFIYYLVSTISVPGSFPYFYVLRSPHIPRYKISSTEDGPVVETLLYFNSLSSVVRLLYFK